MEETKKSTRTSKSKSKKSSTKSVSIPRNHVKVEDVHVAIEVDGRPSTNAYKVLVWKEYEPRNISWFASRLRLVVSEKLIVSTEMNKLAEKSIKSYFKEIDKDTDYVVYE